MSYRRIEVNLLPPELQPGPAVRSALIINIALILITVFTILLSAALSLNQYAVYIQDIAQREQSIAGLQSVKEGYMQLQRIDAAVRNYGKIVGIASTNYIDLPVMLAHLSGVLPERVYLTNVSNVRPGNVSAVAALDANRPTFVTMTFRTANQDMNLITRTLDALKADPVFGNCVLTNASIDSENLQQLSNALGNEVSFTLPMENGNEPAYSFYQFIVRAEVRRPLPDTGARVITDNLELFQASNPLPDKAPPPGQVQPKPAEGGQPATGDATAEPGVVGGPEGVTGTSNRGGN
ncbi:MAG: hypothetical protein R3F46_14190 [bacterium]